MANLIDLTTTLIDSLLERNFYTDINTFSANKSPLQPQIDIAQKLDPIIPKEEIYSKSNSLERKGGPPADLLAYHTSQTPIEGQISSEAYHLGNQYDDGSPSLIDGGGPFKVIPSEAGPARVFDIYATAHWLRGISREVLFMGRNDVKPGTLNERVGFTAETIGKSVQWLASQFLLASFNRGDPQAYGALNLVWNPLSLPLSAIPLLRSTPVTNITAGAVASTYKANAEASIGMSPDTSTERLLLIRQGKYSEVAPVERASKLQTPIRIFPGFVGDLTKAGQGDTLDNDSVTKISGVSVATQVDGGFAGVIAKKMGLHVNLYDKERPYGVENAIMPLEKLQSFVAPADTPKDVELIKLSALFVRADYSRGDLKALLPKAWLAKPRAGIEDGIKSIALPSNLDVGLNPDDEANGILVGTIPPIADAENYMPFMFEDLRLKTPEFLYFRAFIKSGLSENFAPEWTQTRYYGRVDQVPTYMGTTRTLSISFDVVAFSPKDLAVMWKKLKKLQSMVYPMYDTNGFMSAGPIVRIRLGDLIVSDSGRGLPGYITSMNYSYDNAIWEIEPKSKVPRNVSVSLSFTVLHDGNPGITADNVFGATTYAVDPKTKELVPTTVPNNVRKIPGE